MLKIQRIELIIFRMKNNDFLEKYGDRALEKLKKSYNASSKSSFSSLHPSTEKRTSKNSKSKRPSKSKSKININLDPNFTFNKMHQQQGKKRLVISGLSTPKNMVTKVGNNKYGSPSTKKRRDGNSGEKLKTKKDLVKNAFDSLEKVHDKENKVSNWVQQFKLIILKLGSKLQENKKKYIDVSNKNKKLQKQLNQLSQKMPSQCGQIKKKYKLMEQNFALQNTIKQLKYKILCHEKKQLALVEALQQAREFSQGNTLLKIEDMRNENVTEFDVECDDD